MIPFISICHSVVGIILIERNSESQTIHWNLSTFAWIVSLRLFLFYYIILSICLDIKLAHTNGMINKYNLVISLNLLEILNFAKNIAFDNFCHVKFEISHFVCFNAASCHLETLKLACDHLITFSNRTRVDLFRSQFWGFSPTFRMILFVKQIWSERF